MRLAQRGHSGNPEASRTTARADYGLRITRVAALPAPLPCPAGTRDPHRLRPQPHVQSLRSSRPRAAQEVPMRANPRLVVMVAALVYLSTVSFVGKAAAQPSFIPNPLFTTPFGPAYRMSCSSRRTSSRVSGDPSRSAITRDPGRPRTIRPTSPASSRATGSSRTAGAWRSRSARISSTSTRS